MNPIMAGLMLGEEIGVDVSPFVNAYAAELYGPRQRDTQALESALELPGVQALAESSAPRRSQLVGPW